MKNIRKAFIRLFAGLFILLILLFFIFYFTSKDDYEIANTIQQDTSIQHIRLGNTVFHTETYGSDSNETLIVIHGGPGQDYRYLLPLSQLSDNYQVVFYDQRGTGLSPRVSDEELHLDTMIHDLERIIDHYAPNQKVSLLGHSWGAMLATAYLGQHPNRVRKIVLAEPDMLTSAKAKEFLAKTKFRFSFNAMIVVGRTFFKAMHLDAPDDQAKEDFQYMQIALANDMPNHPFQGYFCDRSRNMSSLPVWRYSARSSTQIIRHAKNEKGEVVMDLTKGVDQFEGNVLFLSGECNTITGPAYQKEQMRYFKNPEMVIIPKAGHMMFSDQPNLSIQTVREYLEEN